MRIERKAESVEESLLGLKGKVALVVGGGGEDAKGIGVSSCLLYAAAGAKVVVADLDLARAEAVVKLIRDKGGEASALAVDVGDPAQIDGMVASVLEKYGAIDCMALIVAVAGRGPAIDYDDAAWNRDLHMCLTYAFQCCKAVGTVMIERGRGGSIVCISSVRSFTGSFHLIGYGAAKAGLDSMVRALAVEWGEHNIRVNSIAPGATATPELAGQMEKNVALANKMAVLVPLGRVAEPDEQASVILFLSSKLASYVTGQTILVDGGYLLNHALLMYRDNNWQQ